MNDIKIKKIKILVENYTGSQGTPYIRYKALTKNWETMDCIFTKTVEEKPTRSCIITVDVRDINVEKTIKGKRLWVRKIKSITNTPDDDFVDKIVSEIEKDF